MSQQELQENVNRTKVFDDGIEMEYNDQIKAWVPKITDEFIYMHNLNYGFVNNEDNPPEEVENETVDPPKEMPPWFQRLSKDFQEACEKDQKVKGVVLTNSEYTDRWAVFYQANKGVYEREDTKLMKESKKRQAKPVEVGWFDMDNDKNTFVYVENLPLDITIDEFLKEMSKVGMIMNDFHTHQPKARLYKMKDDDTKNKGDGIVCYLKVESIDLALNILDGSKIRGNEIKVSRAKFEQKEDYVPGKRRKLTNKEKKKRNKHQDKLFSWSLDTKLVRPKKDNTVILKNVFDFEMMKDNPDMAFDIKEKMKNALQQVGQVRSVQVHELHPEGVVQINFLDPNESDIAVTYFNNKLWNGRTISANLWDGKTKYRVKETEEQEQERIAKWDKALEGEHVSGEEKEEDLGSETGDEDAESD